MKSKEGRKKKITPGNERGEREARPIISWNKKKKGTHIYMRNSAPATTTTSHGERHIRAFTVLFSFLTFSHIFVVFLSSPQKKYNNCISYIEKCVSSFILYVYRLRKSLWGMSILLASVLCCCPLLVFFFFGHPPYWLRCALSGNELNS